MLGLPADHRARAVDRDEHRAPRCPPGIRRHHDGTAAACTARAVASASSVPQVHPHTLVGPPASRAYRLSPATRLPFLVKLR